MLTLPLGPTSLPTYARDTTVLTRGSVAYILGLELRYHQCAHLPLLWWKAQYQQEYKERVILMGPKPGIFSDEVVEGADDGEYDECKILREKLTMD